MLLIPNRSGIKKVQKAIPNTMTVIKAMCRPLAGFATFPKIMNPTSPTRMVQAVEMHTGSISNTCPKTTKELTLIKVVIPAGAAILKTLPKNVPLIKFLFGSRESTKDGMPMVNILISVICDGFNGYDKTLIMEKSANSSEKMFFVKNKLAVFSMLFTTRLPSPTTEGILEKSESSSTN